MKKIALLLVVLMALYIVSAPVFSKTTTKVKTTVETITGKIIAIDTTNNAITVQESKSGITKVIGVDAKLIPSLKIGQKVSVKIKTGGNAAESVKIIK